MPLKDKDKKNAYQRKYFKRDGPGYYKQKERILARKREMRAWLQEYKATLGCNRCPENHPACLDFHHKDPEAKELNVSRAADKGWGREKTLREIEKCEVLCSNCHRKEHAASNTLS